MELSVVIAAFNEQPSLPLLWDELRAVADRQHYTLDCIMVDDGSTDGTWQTIEELSRHDGRLRGIRLGRRQGKSAALAAGIAAARYGWIATLDADLQDDPAELPKLVTAAAGGLDVVCGWKNPRCDSRWRRWQSRLFNRLVGWVTGTRLHDHNSGFKLVRREVFDRAQLRGGRHRFLTVLAAAHGFRVGEVVVVHRPRQFGQSKYGPLRIAGALKDLVVVGVEARRHRSAVVVPTRTRSCP